MQVSSKWNDAKKWLAGRHIVHSKSIFLKKPVAKPGHSGDARVTPDILVASLGVKKIVKNQRPRPCWTSTTTTCALGTTPPSLTCMCVLVIHHSSISGAPIAIGGGAAPVATVAAPTAGGATVAALAAKENKEEAKEESDDDMGFSLFD
ncbi:hypothetical protein GUJ93_ZPchr0002g25705 [Zizania palustris]|uniref:Uncharacterized protein n=1 Tax=Zizania palustris TaxID=103762 RepID=A0A8J5S973_ZIZPA|nr:hypothetical protein GUJ93_ZPchr0002g25705 [Zizania palustris]